MNTRCPKCNTFFNVGPADEGKQFTCFNCTAALVMTRDGLRLAGAGAPPATISPGAAPDPVAAPMYAEPLPTGGAPRRPFWRTIDWPTWLFGLGAWLVIVFLFFPLISQAKARQPEALRTIARLHEEQAAAEFDESKSTAAEKDARKKAKDEWTKEDGRLKGEAETSKAHADLEDYWYLWGMMFGFLVLAVAALWYLVPGQPLIRRVVGSVVILAEVVLIFLRFVVEGR